MTRSPSKHNIISRRRGHDDYFVVNVLAGAADLLTREEAEHLRAGGPQEEHERGYVVDAEEEARRFREAYLSAIEARDRDEVQIFFAPSYACNFGCGYCYQSGYAPATAVATSEVVAAFFAYLDAHFIGRRKYLTLFGGEPLLSGARHRAAVGSLVDGARVRDLELAVVTNGFHLLDYLDLLARARVREIQVTLDGAGARHDARRPLQGGGATFDRVVAGIDAALARGLPVNLRVVIDRDNLPHLPELAAFAVARGWTRTPLFKTQLGRNYELHSCQGRAERLYSRLEVHEALYELAREHPVVLELHRPAFALSRTLADTGTLPEPIFDACPGCKTEWAFDHTGRIYPCTATVGKPGEEVGTFFPAATLDEERVALWQDRDVLAIPECRECNLQLACGGGCGAVAKNRTGRLHAPDCRPVRELLELGLGLYVNDAAPTPAPSHPAACACRGVDDARP